eukprot:5602846-Prymnesium_polylepis.1
MSHPRCALQLVPHQHAATLAARINGIGCNPRLRIDNVRPSKNIEAIIKHCKSRWQDALGADATRLVLKAPKEKGGFLILMEQRVCDVQARLFPAGNTGATLIRLEYLLSTDGGQTACEPTTPATAPVESEQPEVAAAAPAPLTATAPAADSATATDGGEPAESSGPSAAAPQDGGSSAAAPPQE